MSAILFEKRGHQAWITLNRPHAKNMLSGEMFEVIPLWTRAKKAETEIERRLQSDVTIADKIMLKDKPLFKPIICAINGRAPGPVSLVIFNYC